jgi:transcription initiation factor TFIIIB Brf1 subunit/transcription initiation factor TFIIB
MMMPGGGKPAFATRASLPALLCRDCGSDALRSVDGVFVCVECGVQSQDILDEQIEWTAGIHSLERGALRRRRGARRERPPPPPPPLAPRAAALAYADGLQRALAAQCDALIASGDAPSELRGVARRLWHAYVAASDVFAVSADAPPAAAAARARRQRRRMADGSAAAEDAKEDDDEGLPPPVRAGSQRLESMREEDEDAEEEEEEAAAEADEEDEEKEDGDGGDDDDEDADGAAAAAAPGESFAARSSALRRLRAALRARLPLFTPLAVLYLAAYWLRLPLTANDVVNRALDGTLPYLSCHVRLPAGAGRGEALPHGWLEPPGAPSAARLRAAAGRVAAALRLPLPPANAAALAARFASELALPKHVGVAAAKLLLLHAPPGLTLAQPGSRDDENENDNANGNGGNATPGVPPECHVMAALLFVLKGCYGLGAESCEGARAEEAAAFARAHPLAEADAHVGWRAWAAARAADAAAAAPLALLPRAPRADDAALPAARLGAYTALLREHVFAGGAPPRGLSEIHAALVALGLPAERAGAVAPAAAGAAAAATHALPVWVPAPLRAPTEHALWRAPRDGGRDYCAVLAAAAAHVALPARALHGALLRLEERAVAAEAAARLEGGGGALLRGGGDGGALPLPPPAEAPKMALTPTAWGDSDDDDGLFAVLPDDGW